MGNMRDVIAKRIREARERCGLSQQELANLMGWKSHASVAAIERGNQDVKTWEILKFAAIMKVSPESLYSEGIKIPECRSYFGETELLTRLYSKRRA